MLVYLVRHAESLTNARESKSLNPALSSLGMQQVERVTRRLAAVEVAAVYSSPFERCLATAIPIAAGGEVRVRLRPELHECYHLPRGKRVENDLSELDEILKDHPSLERCPDYEGAWDWPAHDESSDELGDRMRLFADYLKARWGKSDAAVVVVSHGSPISRLVHGWLAEGTCPSFRYVIDNATISALRFHDGVSTLACLNEASHLVGLSAPEIANYNPDGSIKPQRPPMI